MKMKIRKNILKIVATGIATGLAFSVSCWRVAASDSTNEAKAEETQRKRRNMMLCKRYFWKLIKKQQKISFLN